MNTENKELDIVESWWLGRVFVSAINATMQHCHDIAVSKGWWNGERNDGELIALMHSELSEMLEWKRNGNGKSDHIPDYTGVEEEAADLVIRLFDFCAARGLRLPEAVIAKMKFNEGREFRHGKKF